MTETKRRAVAGRADNCCEYCFSQTLYSHDDFSVEHIQPRSEAGSDEEFNLAWSCQGCNNRKYTATMAPDPTTGSIVPLYNPRTDDWQEHFTWSEDFCRIQGISPTGRATASRLDLNRAGMVNLRGVLRTGGYHPPRLLLFEKQKRTADKP